MHFQKIVATIATILLLAGQAAGQSSSDTIALAKQWMDHGHPRRAAKLLDAWCSANPGQADVLWLLAQAEYSDKKFNRSEARYREATGLQPGNLYLRLDFAEALLNMGRFAKARRELDGLSGEESKDAHALYVLAKYHCWTGDFEKAGQQIAQSRKVARNKPATNALATEIRLAQAPWASFGGALLTDDQPLVKVAPQVSGGKYFHRFADLRAEVSAPFFQVDSSTLPAASLQVTNSARLQKTGTTLAASLGVFKLENQNPGMTGGLRAVQRLHEGWSLTAEAARMPYLRTLSSLDTSVFENQLSAILDWRERHGALLNLGTQASGFGDGNRVAAAWAWALSPPLRRSVFSARVGYGFSYSDARESRFFSKKTLHEILNPYDPDAVIEGIFLPYFTPENMRIHTALANVSWVLGENFSLYLNGSYGFHARAMNPYLYLDMDAGGGLFIQRDFLEMAFTPFDVGAKLAVRFSETLTGDMSYAFTRQFFYENHQVALSLRMVFDH
jgi:tetratricopeptide (TPR) repeat protein